MNSRYWIFIFILFNLSPVVARAEKNCVSHDLESSLQKSYPGWKILSLNDLQRDDRKLWAESHPAACPGFTEGYFENNTIKYLAVTLFKKNEQGLQQIILLTRKTSGKHSFSILSGPDSVDSLSVIYKIKPGTYSNGQDPPIKIAYDSIAFEAIEKGILFYYYRHGKFNSYLLSE